MYSFLSISLQREKIWHQICIENPIKIQFNYKFFWNPSPSWFNCLSLPSGDLNPRLLDSNAITLPFELFDLFEFEFLKFCQDQTAECLFAKQVFFNYNAVYLTVKLHSDGKWVSHLSASSEAWHWMAACSTTFWTFFLQTCHWMILIKL